MLSSNAGHAPVTVIGLGLMGQALAGAFLKDGHPTTVWNRSPEKAEHLRTQGATLAGSIGDAVAAGPLVLVCVSDYEAVHELLDPLGDVLADRVVVNLTSGTSKQARDTAGWAARRGFTYLDGAILAIPRPSARPTPFCSTAGRGRPSTCTSRPCGAWVRAPPISVPIMVWPRCTTWRCWASCGAF